MTDLEQDVDGVSEIDLTDMAVLRDPFTAYGAARERSPIARIQIPGIGPVWVVTRHAEARAMLSDPRFVINADSFTPPPGIPEECQPYMRTMAEMNGAEHMRLRKLVAPAFTARRAAEFRPRIERIVENLLDQLPSHADADAASTVDASAETRPGSRADAETDNRADSRADNRADNGADNRAGTGAAPHGARRSVDLLQHFARPLPIEVICELVGIPEVDRPDWRTYGAIVAAGMGQRFAEAVPGIVDGARAAIVRRRDEPADDLISDLIRAQAEDGDRLSDTELITLVWHLVLAGQTPTNLIANSVRALLLHPGQRTTLRADPHLIPPAVEELIRWCGPTLLTIPRYAREDLELGGVLVAKGEPATAAVAAANRDPRAFAGTGAHPDQLDVGRTVTPPGHLGFGHGPHFCLGSAVARVETEVALTGLLRRFPDLALAVSPEEVQYLPDPGTLRLAALPVTW